MFAVWPWRFDQITFSRSGPEKRLLVVERQYVSLFSKMLNIREEGIMLHSCRHNHAKSFCYEYWRNMHNESLQSSPNMFILVQNSRNQCSTVVSLILKYTCDQRSHSNEKYSVLFIGKKELSAETAKSCLGCLPYKYIGDWGMWEIVHS